MAQYNTAMQVWVAMVSLHVDRAASDHLGRTYNTQRADYHIRWSIVVADHLRDEVCGHTDDGNQRYALKDPDDLESPTEGSIV